MAFIPLLARHSRTADWCRCRFQTRLIHGLLGVEHQVDQHFFRAALLGHDGNAPGTHVVFHRALGQTGPFGEALDRANRGIDMDGGDNHGWLPPASSVTRDLARCCADRLSTYHRSTPLFGRLGLWGWCLPSEIQPALRCSKIWLTLLRFRSS